MPVAFRDADLSENSLPGTKSRLSEGTFSLLSTKYTALSLRPQPWHQTGHAGTKTFYYYMANTADISRGMIIKLDGSLYSVVEFGENKTARAAAKVWAKLKGVDNNRSIEKTWNSGDSIYPVRVEKRNYQYLYKDDTGYNFMDNETFEQVALQENLVDAPQFLKEGQEVGVLINTETEQPMSVELPDKIVMLVTYTEPGLKGDTATRTLKQATVETGATVNVPLFVNEGEMIRVNTKTGEYVERVKE